MLLILLYFKDIASLLGKKRSHKMVPVPSANKWPTPQISGVFFIVSFSSLHNFCLCENHHVDFWRSCRNFEHYLSQESKGKDCCVQNHNKWNLNFTCLFFGNLGHDFHFGDGRAAYLKLCPHFPQDVCSGLTWLYSAQIGAAPEFFCGVLWLWEWLEQGCEKLKAVWYDFDFGFTIDRYRYMKWNF